MVINVKYFKKIYVILNEYWMQREAYQYFCLTQNNYNIWSCILYLYYINVNNSILKSTISKFYFKNSFITATNILNCNYL